MIEELQKRLEVEGARIINDLEVIKSEFKNKMETEKNHWEEKMEEMRIKVEEVEKKRADEEEKRRVEVESEEKKRDAELKRKEEEKDELGCSETGILAIENVCRNHISLYKYKEVRRKRVKEIEEERRFEERMKDRYRGMSIRERTNGRLT